MERLVDVDTPLGSALWFRQMTGTEALSNLFEFDITFHSKQSGLSAKAMLGNPITMKVETEGGGVRHFNGICTRFASSGREGEHLLYVAKVRPWLWLASRRTDCRIFQHLSAPEIIQQVLDLYGHPVRKKLVKTYRKWEYCVQYQESDMHFVMRMMEHEGIYFYFEHSSANHTLVMADDMNASHSALPGRSTIKYYGVDAAGVVGEEHFNSWLIREEVDSGHYFTDDYDFEKPSTDLSTARQRPMGHAHDAYEVYEWPGGYTQHPDGEFYADARMDMLVAEHERAAGYTTLRSMAPGYRFTLT
ncbi:MAG: type VI secretion system tip protein VgrG, partial [Proteobacteria bacterium]|nr:type VI secretion system tip protein VgrG [Pseudomonadota bacterium]